MKVLSLLSLSNHPLVFTLPLTNCSLHHEPQPFRHILFHAFNRELLSDDPPPARQDKAEDIRTLVDSFTAPALAAALRDRETALHACAHLLDKASQRYSFFFGGGGWRFRVCRTPQRVLARRACLRLLECTRVEAFQLCFVI